MKKAAVLALILLEICCLLLTGCEQKNADPVWNAEELWQRMLQTEGMPEMVTVPADKCEYIFGVMEEDCAQELLSICQNSMLADEIWLVEAKDSETADKIEKLASARIGQKADELRDYAPDQYQVVQKAKLIRRGTQVVLIISPLSEELAAMVK